MSLELAFELLPKSPPNRSREEVEELHVNAAEFFPPSRPGHARGNGDQREERPPSPAETLAENALVLQGDLQTALIALEKIFPAIRPPRNLQRAQSGLSEFHQFLNEALIRFRTEVAEPNGLGILSAMARDRGEAWLNWMTLIHTIINTLREKMLETWQALCQCWEELAEKLSDGAVSVQATNIGQQITMHEDQLELTTKAT